MGRGDERQCESRLLGRSACPAGDDAAALGRDSQYRLDLRRSWHSGARGLWAVEGRAARDDAANGVEYAPYGIRVNAIGCGTVDTPIVYKSAEQSGDPEKFWAMLRDNHPIGRIAAAEEVASFFTYLASDLASFFTGSILMMDGGFTAK